MDLFSKLLSRITKRPRPEVTFTILGPSSLTTSTIRSLIRMSTSVLARPFLTQSGRSNTPSARILVFNCPYGDGTYR
jgi:hypothetical protein